MAGSCGHFEPKFGAFGAFKIFERKKKIRKNALSFYRLLVLGPSDGDSLGAGRIERLMYKKKLPLKKYLSEFSSFEFSIFRVIVPTPCGHFEPKIGAFGAFKIFERKKKIAKNALLFPS